MNIPGASARSKCLMCGSLRHAICAAYSRVLGGANALCAADPAPYLDCVCRDIQRPTDVHGGLVFKAHRRVYHSTLGWRVIQKKYGHTALKSRPDASGAGSYLRLIDSCITQLKAQGPSRTCNESIEEEKKKTPLRP